MLTSFDKKGLTFKVEANENSIKECAGTYAVPTVIVTVDGISALSEIINHPQGGWCYVIENDQIIRNLGGSSKQTKALVTHASAEKVKVEVIKMKEEYFQEMLKTPLTFEARNIEFFACDMEMKDTVLCPSKEAKFWTSEEKACFKELNLKETIAMHDSRVSVPANELKFVEGQVVTLADLVKVTTETAEILTETAEVLTEAKAFAEAAQTGEKVRIRSYALPCSDPTEECEIDVITVWALPDGRIEETRQHTW